ncbi:MULTISPECIES: hypothetical protein [unclassified Streptomyces]|uniref:hypothetical protein n=1 Tax=unclassified Streptomyces TaxID=2593676 RepID=UPI003329AA0A
MKHPRGATGVAAAVAATGLVLAAAGAAPAQPRTGPERITSRAQLARDIAGAVAREQAAASTPLSPAARGLSVDVPAVLPC